MWNVGLGYGLAALCLLGCSADPFPLMAPATDPRASTVVGGDTVGNGGGELTAVVQNIARVQLLEALERPVNREVLAKYYSPAEIRYLLGLLESGLAVRVVVPSLLEKNQYEDGAGKPAEVEGERLLDRDRVPADSRVVRDVRSKRWLIQLDEAFVKRNYSDKEPNRILLRQLAHELFRLGYHSKQTKFADDDNELSVELRFKPPFKLPKADFKIWEGGRKFKLLENGMSFGHRRVSVVGQRYEGVVNCGEAQVHSWLPVSGAKIESKFCYLTLVFTAAPGSATRGKLHHRVETYPERKDPKDNTYDFVEDEAYVEVKFPGGETVIEAMVFGDVLELGMSSTVFRIDGEAYAVAGHGYRATLFKDTSAYALAMNIPDFVFETASDALSLDQQETALTFLDDKTMHYRGSRYDPATQELIEVDRDASYQQIGNIVILHLDEEPGKPEPASAQPNRFYFWLRQGSHGKELVTAVGDSLFRNDVVSTIPAVEGTFSSFVDCSEVSWIAPENRRKSEFREEGGMGCEVELTFANNGWVEIRNRVHYPHHEERKPIRGYYVQVGRHVYVTAAGKTPFNTYKLLPNGELSDVFDNIFVKRTEK